MNILIRNHGLVWWFVHKQKIFFVLKLKIISGNGILTSTGKKWLKRRKIITPTFHFSILEEFVEVFDRQIDVFIEKLRPFSGKGDIDIFHFSSLCSLDIICGNSYFNCVEKNSNSINF